MQAPFELEEEAEWQEDMADAPAREPTSAAAPAHGEQQARVAHRHQLGGRFMTVLHQFASDEGLPQVTFIASSACDHHHLLAFHLETLLQLLGTKDSCVKDYLSRQRFKFLKWQDVNGFRMRVYTPPGCFAPAVDARTLQVEDIKKAWFAPWPASKALRGPRRACGGKARGCGSKARGKAAAAEVPTDLGAFVNRITRKLQRSSSTIFQCLQVEALGVPMLSVMPALSSAAVVMERAVDVWARAYAVASEVIPRGEQVAASSEGEAGAGRYDFSDSSDAGDDADSNSSGEEGDESGEKQHSFELEQGLPPPPDFVSDAESSSSEEDADEDAGDAAAADFAGDTSSSAVAVAGAGDEHQAPDEALDQADSGTSGDSSSDDSADSSDE
ncbi:hypothetical protein JKP88DRAFT_272815 [Tribonema minus]|uniref:Uncharacterized protein n=1 Tax=Tribonema minus TaxID=303371 RepID=A0A836CGE7_9STRA|nr:hypothetical protein JKP88DRAFT_272815 [Tribonema minus]